jgi:lipopolysaccharide/colanic/teichoic acid biosynthesis glycosyltransferase
MSPSTSSARPGSLYRRGGKRLLDLAFALPLLLLASPLIAGLALLVRARMGSPVLFRQERPGIEGRPFTLLKLRTMTDARDSAGRDLSDAERLTGLGRWLRRTSLDELPELWNVVRGDLGLVGPRPLLTEYLPLYSGRQARRHEVRPGVTGWAQVHGRNAVSWPEKLALDVEYVERCSLALDLSILARTVILVLRGEGVSAEGHATMPRFRGGDGGV